MEKNDRMTKKAFKELCNFQTYTGHRVKINAIYFDFKQGTDDDGKFFIGYKYMFYSNVKNISKQDLFNRFYEWIFDQVHPTNYIRYRYAENDQKRFKVSLSL
jgi:hypothetical protein